VKGAAIRCFLDLGAATKAVGDDQGVFARRSDRREENAFSAGNRDVILIGFESKGTRHPAASGLGFVEIYPDLLE
jgi:hypothetical protein